MATITKSPDPRTGPNAQVKHRTRQEIAQDVEESRQRSVSTRLRSWNGLERGDPVYVEGHDAGKVYIFDAYCTSRFQRTSWVDVTVPGDEYGTLYPTRPEAVRHVAW